MVRIGGNITIKRHVPSTKKMLAMCSGKMANGDCQHNTFGTANSATGSETGSSDVPQTRLAVLDDCSYLNFGFDPTDSQMEGTVQQPISQSGCEASPSILDTMGASRDSGSQKRKSTDDGSNMSKGKKIQRRISEKSKGIKIIVETGAQLVKLNEQLVDEVGRSNKTKEERYCILDGKEKEFDMCLEKLNNLQVDPIAFHIIRGKFKEADERRYFLRASDEEIATWINLLRYQQCQNFGMSPNIGFNPQGGLHPQGGVNPHGGAFFMNPNLHDPIGIFSNNFKPSQQWLHACTSN